MQILKKVEQKLKVCFKRLKISMKEIVLRMTSFETIENTYVRRLTIIIMSAGFSLLILAASFIRATQWYFSEVHKLLVELINTVRAHWHEPADR